jgi:hypothetical protein
MKPMALVGAVAGGALGAFIWALVACLTGFEIGYVAWGVGGLVGFGCYALGGRGQTAAITAAGLALASILVGKALTIQQILSSTCMRQLYDFFMPQAEAFVHVDSEDECRAFMVANHYTEASSPDQVPNEEVDEFNARTAPLLKDMGEKKPSFDEWEEEPTVQALFGKATQDAPIMSILFESLGPIDLIFAFLGIATAYQVCMRPGKRAWENAA